MRLFVVIICILSLSLFFNLYAQDLPYNHPELDWYTIETEHFNVHYHEGTERTAKLTAKISEDIYGPVTALYQYEPDGKIHFIIRDHDDFSNGAAYYYDNKVEIWSNPMDFILRGTHNWLRNVITHEFSHIISLGAARKMPRNLPAIYFQYLGYEPEKNPYVLYGFPNKIISYPLAGTVIPMWLAEGIAQFQLPTLNYDTWDTHRDMLLRTATLEGKLLDHKEMGVFGDTSIRNESVYNQGYSMTQYIVDRYGLDALQKITHQLKTPWRVTVNGALKQTIGISEEQLYQDWKTYLIKYYSYRTGMIRDNLIAGDLIQLEGEANIYPVWSPDGLKYAFLSNRKSDYISRTNLYIYDFEHNTQKLTKPGVNYSLSWSPDGSKIAYTKTSKPTASFSHYNDIYVYDFSTRKEKRMTKNRRAHDPDWSPDGDKLLYIVTQDGTQNIECLDLTTNETMMMTDFKNGEQVFAPKWSPDGRKIVVSISMRDERDLMLYDLEDRSFSMLIEEADARDAVFTPDGTAILFSWDKSGIFNIYRLDLADQSEVTQLTNVLGGAFMPSMDKSGRLLFSSYGNQRFSIAKIETPQSIEDTTGDYIAYEHNFHLASSNPDELIPVFKQDQTFKLDNYNDEQVPDYTSAPYEYTYSNITFLPRIMVDYGTTKLGTYMYSSDILNKYSIMGGVAANRDLDYDLFAIVEYNRFLPTIFLEGYYQVRHHEQKDTLYIQDDFVDYREYTQFAYRYNLMEVDLGLKSYLINEMNRLKFTFMFNRYSANVKYDIQGDEYKFPYTYFKGKSLKLEYSFSNFLYSPWFDSDINPSGKRILTLAFSQEFNDFFNDFKLTEYGTWSEKYDRYNYSKVDLDWQEYIGLFRNGKHTLNLHLQGGAILEPVHEFFNYFAGGLVGLRGYPYYSIEGRKLLLGRATYRFPVLENLNLRILNLHFDKLYGGLFFDSGDAFDADRVNLSEFKNNYGFEVRLDLFSFYSFPTRIFFNAAYGLDEFIKKENDGLIELTYGKEWRYYLGITFGYFN
ncbi:PD40 domain-containing protein [candidate division KSB1 bacterium]|nr:PD40 domain-containing protein [candidate division KSB1 bacterium]